MKQLHLHLRLDCGFDIKVMDEAIGYLKWPLLFDTHYPGITRRHQEWTHCPFLQRSWNKDLHYMPGILKTFVGPYLLEAALQVTCQLPGLLHLPVKTRFSASCSMTKAGLSCQKHEWPAVQTCLPGGSSPFEIEFLKKDEGDKLDEQVISHFCPIHCLSCSKWLISVAIISATNDRLWRD